MRKQIVGHKGRDQFLDAVTGVIGLSALEVRLAVQLALFFNCTTGQCNPGYTKLGEKLSVHPRSIMRACDTLEAFGLIRRKRSAGGNQKDKTSFELFHFPRGDHIVTRTSDDSVTRQAVTNGSSGVTETTRRGDKNEGVRVTTAVTQNTEFNTESNTEKSAPPARSSARVDRVYRLGASVLGNSASDLITRLIDACEGNTENAACLVEMAAEERNPRGQLEADIRSIAENTFIPPWDF